MNDAVNEQNTRMPDTSQIAEVARNFGRMGFDVHTVKLELNGTHGGFDVDFLATDDDLQDYCFEFLLDSSGSLERY